MLFYLLKTGCCWRIFPKEFHKWKFVYYYYRKWASLNEFDLLLERLPGSISFLPSQHQESSAGIVDSRSVKWGNNRSLNDMDENKEVKGIKRHVVVGKKGFLVVMMVSITNIHDSKAVYLLM